MTDLVVVSLEAWDLVWRRNQHLVAQLLRADPTLRVLFVEPAADPLFAVSRRRVPRFGRGLRPGPALDGVQEGHLWLYEPTKVLPRRMDRHADDRLAARTRAAARQRGMESPVLWINDPAAARLVAATTWPALYDITDDWVAAERTPSEHRRLLEDEALLLERCVEVVVCSPRLVTTKGRSRDVTLVTNGVDLDRYRAPHPRPADLPPGRVAVYVGTVHPDRFDVALLERTARHLGDAGTVVLVGPVVDLSRSELDGLADAGVVLLGARPWDAVPAYLQHADALVVPHLVNEFTDSLDPIKLYEYRAAGRPVVATPVAGFRDAADPLVTVAGDSAFAEAVRHALSVGAPTAATPPAVLDIPTWGAQAALMAEAVRRTERHAATRR
jgi:glycosyltransferase involved in cell wall biosynthesis